jgi:hypothetical protein
MSTLDSASPDQQTARADDLGNLLQSRTGQELADLIVLVVHARAAARAAHVFLDELVFHVNADTDLLGLARPWLRPPRELCPRRARRRP